MTGAGNRHMNKALDPILRIAGGRVLIDERFADTTIAVTPARGVIRDDDEAEGPAQQFDAEGLLLLPGIVDIHGDAFERQMMPRPGVDFPIDVALLDTDRQVVANGITTVFHGVTWSWEPGLRGPENARAILEEMERLRPQLAADTRFHLRHETYNLDAEPEIMEWLAGRRIDLLAFNDHMSSIADASGRPDKLSDMVKRSGLTREAFESLIERVKRRGNEVPASIERLAGAACQNGVPLLSHDDATPDQRRWFRSLGCRIAEFPVNVETAQEAASGDDPIVFGAPNVVRGGSHTGWTKASDMVARGLCAILASDYYYPAPLLAAFRLAADGTLPLERAWTLVSGGPAAAVGMTDRGRIAAGHRADLILVDARDELRPQVVATLVGGRIVHLTDASRLRAA